MKNKLTFILYFICLTVSSQIIRGTVVDSLQNKPLDFVNVFLKKSTFGTFTDTIGKFEIGCLDSSDSLFISRIGYRTKKYKISEINIEKELRIDLTEAVEKLNEIIIVSKKVNYTAEKKIKDHSKKEESNYFSFQFGTEHCVYVSNPSKIRGKLEIISLELNEVKDGTKSCKECKVDYITDFNIKFYEYDEKTKKPGNEIYDKPILIIPQNKSYTLKINLKDLNIPFPDNGICIGVEVINTKYKNPKLAGAITAPSLNFDRIRKPINNESWVRYRNIGNWNFKSFKGRDKKGGFLDRLKIDLSVKFEKE